MNTALPTAEELEKLPMRAVVAYAARTARRLSSELRGVIEVEILDDALRLVDAVSTADRIGEIDQVSVIAAAERVAEAYATAPAITKSLKQFRIVFSLVQAALAAMNAIAAAVAPQRARYDMKRAATSAERAVRPIDALDELAARSATEAARQDYETLVRVYGQHDDVIIGEPVSCFEASGPTITLHNAEEAAET